MRTGSPRPAPQCLGRPRIPRGAPPESCGGRPLRAPGACRRPGSRRLVAGTGVAALAGTGQRNERGRAPGVRPQHSRGWRAPAAWSHFRHVTLVLSIRLRSLSTPRGKTSQGKCGLKTLGGRGALFGITTLVRSVRVHPGRPAALPAASGWDEELRARTAGVRLPRPGHSESLFRTDPSVCPIMLRTGTDSERSDWRSGMDERPKSNLIS